MTSIQPFDKLALNIGLYLWKKFFLLVLFFVYLVVPINMKKL
ncbi:hypothetical protein PJ15_1475 [Acinetobacter sp. neg1]|nr:hypothetical protein PJ15_1475 [Acinetobacter sp. neg1]